MVGSVTDDRFCEQMILDGIKHFGQLDVLVNNAGIGKRSNIDSEALMEVRHN